MNNLKKKIFLTIFSILSLFSLVFFIIYNTQIYNREYKGIEDSLTRLKTYYNESELKNKMFIDYELYTFLLDYNDNIVVQISHNDKNIDPNVLEISQKIINTHNESKIKIGNLYLTNYAYNYQDKRFLTIVNISNIKTRLLINLYISLLLVVLSSLFIYFISKKITDWITIPVLDSFNREKEFVANASHELKTPLAVIMASTDCIKENNQNKKWLNNIKNESERMNNLVTKLLDLTASENLNLKENMSINNLSLIIEKSALTFDSLAYEKNIKIKTDIEENINLFCNKGSIEELMSILIDNAIKHSIKGSTIIVNLKVQKEIIIEVINQGDEIPKSESEKIFERFYRSDKSHNRNENRYGLGLSIAKNIVTSHDGNIKAFSRDGYTTFKVTFKKK